jgi:hypothetical protein
MHGKITTWLAWIWFGVFVTTVIGTMMAQIRSANEGVWELLEGLLFSLFVAVYSFVGALIVSRQPRNTVGWLLMIPPTAFALNGLTSIYVESFEAIPAEPSTLFLVVAWLNNALFVPMLFSALFSLQLFPTGRVLSPRWRWLVALGLSLSAIIPAMTFFEKEFPVGDTGAVPNPIGFLSPNTLLTAIITAGFALFIIGSAASLFARYRRAGQVERQQIKWLLYTCSLFVVALLLSSALGDLQNLIANLLNLAFVVTFTAIPVAIAIAILRHNLWDINVIIRKTAIYAVLTALLATVYFGVIILLRSIFEAVSGQQSPISIVISTLIIAALFSPLRRRVQAVIDRRFFRAEYNAQQVLAEFARRAQDETDLRTFQAELIRMVQGTLQPEQISLWIRPTEEMQQPRIADELSQRQQTQEL